MNFMMVLWRLVCKRNHKIKDLQLGYYWLTFFKNAHDYCRNCDVCQAYAQQYTMSGPLHPIPPLGPFKRWGIDLIRSLLVTREGINCGYHIPSHKVYRSTCLEVFSETRSGTSFV
jgi:hypothetical protein